MNELLEMADRLEAMANTRGQGDGLRLKSIAADLRAAEKEDRIDVVYRSGGGTREESRRIVEAEDEAGIPKLERDLEDARRRARRVASSRAGAS